MGGGATPPGPSQPEVDHLAALDDPEALSVEAVPCVPGAGRPRLVVEPSVADEEADPETLELLAVTREPGAAVEPVEPVSELEGLLGRERVPVGRSRCAWSV